MAQIIKKTNISRRSSDFHREAKQGEL